MNTTPYELVFGQPPRQNVFPGAEGGTEILEEEIEDLLLDGEDLEHGSEGKNEDGGAVVIGSKDEDTRNTFKDVKNGGDGEVGNEKSSSKGEERNIQYESERVAMEMTETLKI
jgi:hypothetical protein